MSSPSGRPLVGGFYADGIVYADGRRRRINVYADGVYYADGPFVGFLSSPCTLTAPTFGRRRIGRPSATCLFPVVCYIIQFN